VEKKKAKQKTPHFFSLNQDIVPWSSEEKCELKYVIYIFSRQVRIANIDNKKSKANAPLVL